MTDRPFDTVDVAAKRATTSLKWGDAPADVIPAWVAEHDFTPPPEVFDAFRRVADTGDVGYTRREGDLGAAYAPWARDRHGWEIDPALVSPHVDVLQGVVAAVTALSEPGDGVILTPPIYFPFLDICPTSGRRQVDWELRRDEHGWHVDLGDLEAILRADPDARVLLLSHPHNPTGRVLGRDTLTALVELCAEHDVFIVSDEIHGDLVHPGATFVPLLTIPGAAERVVTVTSPAKTFCISGLRCGISVYADPALRRRVRRAHPPLLLAHPGRGGLEATIACWTHGGPWTDELVAQLTKRRDHLAARLAAEAPAVGFHPPESTFLAWLDVSACGLGPAPAERLLERARVSLNEGTTFGAGGEGHVRLNFGTSRELLDEILDRLLPHLAAG